MMAAQVIGGTIFGVIALAMAVYVSFTVRCKGPILSNRWIFLTAEEKKKADKKAEYKLVSVVFGCLAGAFAMGSLEIFTGRTWPRIVLGILILFALVYAVVDAVRTEMKKKD